LIVFDKLQENNRCIYLNEPVPIRVQLIKLLRFINPDYIFNSSHITISELTEAIIKELDYSNLIIIFNHFDRLTKKSGEIYQNLNTLSNIQFICSFNEKINNKVYSFYKTFKFINKAEYKEKAAQKEINITYSLYILISILCFFVYIKSANSLYMATILLGGAWFALIIFRTLMYAGGRV